MSIVNKSSGKGPREAGLSAGPWRMSRILIAKGAVGKEEVK